LRLCVEIACEMSFYAQSDFRLRRSLLCHEIAQNRRSDLPDVLDGSSAKHANRARLLVTLVRNHGPGKSRSIPLEA
jgi:hypothetical protein